MTKTNRLGYRTVLSTLIVVVLGVFSIGMYLMMRPNLRVYVNGCIRAQADLTWRGAATYNVAYIGTWEQPYDGSVHLEIMLADGTMFEFPNVDVELMRAKAEGVRASTRNWPSSAKEFLLVDCRVIADGGTVLQIAIYSDTKIRTSQVTRWYSFPMSEREIIELFGSADRIVDSRAK